MVLLRYLISFLIIVGTNSVYIYATGPMLKIVILIDLLLLIYRIIQVYTTRINTSVPVREVIMNLFYGLLFSVFFIVHINDSILNNTGHLMLLLGLFAMTFLFVPILESDLRLWLKSFINVLVGLAIISIVFYLLGTTLHFLHPTSYVSVNWGGQRTFPSYHGLYFDTQTITILSHVFARNSGIFVESPVFGGMLGIAAVFSFVLLQKKINWKMMVVLLALITTTSSTGLALYAISAYIYLVKRNRDNQTSFTFFVIKLIGRLIALGLIVYLGTVLISAKLGTSSGSLRLDDFQSGFHAFLKHPLVGNGLLNIDAISSFMTSANRHIWVNGMPYYNTGLASSFVQVISDGGVLLSLLYFLPFFEKKGNWLFKGLIAIVHLLSIYTYTPLLFLLISILRTDINKERN